MFDKLIDLIVSIASRASLIRIVSQWEHGVVLRLGKRHRVVREPGVVWTIPFVDNLITTEVVPTTMTTGRRDFTIPGGQNLSVDVVVTWRVYDVEKYLLDVYDGKDAVLDALTGTIGEVLEQSSQDDVPKRLATKIRRRANAKAKHWGVTFDNVQFSSFVTARTYRLLGDTARQD